MKINFAYQFLSKSLFILPILVSKQTSTILFFGDQVFERTFCLCKLLGDILFVCFCRGQLELRAWRVATKVLVGPAVCCLDLS